MNSVCGFGLFLDLSEFFYVSYLQSLELYCVPFDIEQISLGKDCIHFSANIKSWKIPETKTSLTQ